MKNISLFFLLALLFSCHNENNSSIEKDNTITTRQNEEKSIDSINIKRDPRYVFEIVKKSVHKLPSNEDINSLTYPLNLRATQDSVKKIDANVILKKLKKYKYPHRSMVGGFLRGYYTPTSNLKYIMADNAVEYWTNSYRFYFNENKIIKIFYTEIRPNWQKYNATYPSDKYKFDEKKLKYDKEKWAITFSESGIKFEKESNNKWEYAAIDSTLVRKLLHNGYQMEKELELIKVFEAE